MKRKRKLQAAVSPLTATSRFKYLCQATVVVVITVYRFDWSAIIRYVV